MIIVLTPAANAFAENHDGPAALKACVERELEELFQSGLEKAEDLYFHIFLWNDREFIMGPQGAEMVVDLIDDDDHTTRMTIDPSGGQEPDAAPIPSAKE